MAGKTVTYYVDVDSTGAVKGWRKAEQGQARFEGQTKSTAKSLLSLDNVAKIAAAGGIGLVLQKALTRSIEKGREFESQLANIEAITGISGDRLDRLASRSLELSKIYGESASNIIEANKLVASQLAEKIDFNTEAGFQELQKVSEEAIVLSKATGATLNDAVAAVTSTINQFNLSAGESNRVINSLAAGSKFGAAEVPAIAAALVNAGSAAAGANASIEETNALIQVLAANGQEGERAGTALRAIFLRLQTAGEDLAEYGLGEVDIKANGVTETLRQLTPILDDASAMKKIFGEEAFNAASILIREADSVASLTEKVTGSNVAYEQAATNMDTFDGAADRLQSTVDAELIPAFQESNGVLVVLINSVSSLIEQFAGGIAQINAWIDTHHELRRELGLAEHQTDAQVASMKSLRRELANAAIQGNLTKQEQEDLREAYERTTEHLKTQENVLFGNTFALQQQKVALQNQIDKLKEGGGAFAGWAGHAKAAKLDELNEEMQALDLRIDSNMMRLEEYSVALKEGSISFEEFIQKMKAANEAQNEGGGGSGTENQINDLRTLAGLQAEYAAEKKKFEKASNDASRDAHNQRMSELRGQIEAIQQRYNAEKNNLSTIKGVKAEISDTEQKYLEAASDAEREEHAKKMTELYEILKGLDIIAERKKENHETFMEQYQQEINMGLQLFSALSRLSANLGARRINDLQEQKEEMNDYYENRLENDRLSEQERKKLDNERQQRELAIEKRIAAEKKKAAKARKAWAISQIAIETAINVAEAFPNVFLMAAAGALGAVQIAAVAAEPVPQFATGGAIRGRRHSAGGTLINAEDGEYVINRESTRKFLPLLDAINFNPNIADRIMMDTPSFDAGGLISPGSFNVKMPSGSTQSMYAAVQAGIRDAFRSGMIVGKVEGRDIRLSYERQIEYDSETSINF